MTKPDKPKSRFTVNATQQQRRGPGKNSRRLSDQSQSSPETAEAHEKLAKIAGLQAVTALFRRNPDQVIRLYYDDKMKNAVGEFCAQMAKMHRPYRLVDEGELEKIAGTILHGGVVAAATPRAVPDFDIEDAKAWARSGEPLVILDGVGNPHNLGAIARTMAYFGLKFLLISDHPSQAGLSDAAHRVAEGGLEYIGVYRTKKLPAILRSLQNHYRVVGTALTNQTADLSKLAADPRPPAVVLGNEESGLSGTVLDACETTVLIRGSGRVQSLNVAATAAILIHQIASGKPRTKAMEPDGNFNKDRQNALRKRTPGTIRGNRP